MRKTFSILFFALLLAFSTFASFFVSTNAQNVATAETSSTPEIISGFVLSQDGHVFSSNDFEIKENGDRYLYVNTTITLTKTSDRSAGYAHVYWRTLSNANIEPMKLLQDKGEYKYFSYDGSAEVVTRVQITLITGSSSAQFNFTLVQTPVHFSTSIPYTWTNNSGNTVVAPTTSQPYADKLTLSGISGTVNSPIYVDLYYNGEFYGLFHDGEKFYNRITGNQLDATSLTFSAAGKYRVYIYDKTIYCNIVTKKLTTEEYNNLQEDLTYSYLNAQATSIPTHANLKSYAFEIKLSSNTANYLLKNMYITASDTDGNDITYSQTVNDAVYLKFYNISATLVARIVLTIYHPDMAGNNIPEYITLAKNATEINKLVADGLYFEDDGNYTIAFFDTQGNSLLPAYDEATGKEITNPRKEYNSYGIEVVAEVPMFKFNILTNIRTQYRGNSAYNLAKNEIQIRNIKEVEYRWFTGLSEIESSAISFVQGINSNEYILKLANPDIKISGVTNGASISDSATLTVGGVGEIKVTVTKDNTTSTYTLSNGQTIPNTSEIGNYTVKIKDEMGNEASVSFSISKSLNIATVALIIIGSAILGIGIFLIFRLRTRIRVR